MIGTGTRRRATPFATTRSLLLSWFEGLAIGFVIVAVGVGAYAGAPISRFIALLAGFLAALLVVVAVCLLVFRMQPALVRLMAGIALTFVIYGSLTPILEHVAGPPIDNHLRSIEEAWLGVALPLVLEPYVSDGLTIFFALAYSIHAPLFFIPVLAHMRDGRFDRAERLGLGLALAMYFGFVGYVLFPALGPVGTLSGLRPLGENIATRIVADYGVDLGTFPSLHAGISFAVALDGWRRSWRRGLAFTLVAALIWSSTLYLRYHWVPDLIAGALLAIVSYWLAGRLIPGRRIPEWQMKWR